MAIHFDNFSPQAFECLVQALCVHKFGSGTIIFGVGPDGAREATFEGEIPFPSTVDRWKGYTVVQAKCRQHLRNDADDTKWLASQLTHDLDKFLDVDRSLRRPDFYLLVSNVSLSSVANSGGKAKIDRILGDYQTKIGIKRFAVWTADELRALLENAEDIRRAYTAWLTPSDVLASLVERLDRPNLTKLLPLALTRDLRNERDVRLKDAGQETEKAIYLEDVFIDLPLITTDHSLHVTPKNNRLAPEPQNTGVVNALLDRATDKLDPDSIRAHRKEGTPLRNRIVILGGPGQGKSTLTQFVMQLERARLLSTHRPSSINPQASDLIKPIMDRALSESLTLDRPTRFPFRVDLPDFADAVQTTSNKGGKLSLISFMCQRLFENLDVRILPNDLREWLGACPSLIVLDGLDEVPQTANRGQLISSIDSFWDDLHLVQADAMVVVTTRPQGYNNDLDPAYWEHWELDSLGIPHVVRFSQRLAEVRLSNAAARLDIVNSLRGAAADETTKLLVTSPLQIAILFGIVLLKGAVPKDRWELFDRYYTLLRDREAQKPKSIVREFKRQIDLLHKRVGFLLHVNAEKVGKSVSYFSPEQLKEIIKQLLTEDEFPKDDIERIANQLKTAATDRLVFLAARVTDQIAFDVRSLQEFMAAGQITAASPAHLVERLREISKSQHWRNVLRISASKVFSETDFGYYRDDIVGICHSLDAGDLGDEFRLVRAGGFLALELLTDGISNSAPKYRKSLLRRAFTVIDICPELIPTALVDQFSSATVEIFEEQLRSRLKQGNTQACKGAFKLLFDLLGIESEWSERLIFEFWPEDSVQALALIPLLNLANCTDRLRARIRDDQWRMGPMAALRVLNSRSETVSDARIAEFGAGFSVLPPAYYVYRDGAERRDFLTVVIVPGASGHDGLSSLLLPLSASPEFEFKRDPPQEAGWEPLVKISEFARKPSKRTLAAALKCLDAFADYRAFTSSFPWILQSLIALKTNSNTFSELSQLVLANAFGGLIDWERAEQRWVKSGLTKSDLVAANRRVSIGGGIGKLGCPPLLRLELTHEPLDLPRAVDLLAAACEVRDDEAIYRLSHVALFIMHNPDIERRIDASSFVTTIADRVANMSSPYRGMLLKELLESILAPFNDSTFLMFLHELARDNPFYFISMRHSFGRLKANDLVKIFIDRNELRGLLVIVAKYVLVAKVQVDTLSATDLTWRSDDSESIVLAVAILKLATGHWDFSEVEILAEHLVAAAKFDAGVIKLLSRAEGSTHGLELLLSIGKRTDELPVRLYSEYADVLKRLSNIRPSSMRDVTVRSRLLLPCHTSEEN